MDSADDNCSSDIPYSQIYLQEVSVAEKVLMAVCTLLTVAVVLLFADKVLFIHRNYGNFGHHELIKYKSIVLVGIYPATAIASLLATFVPRARLLCDFLATVYLAVCLYQFTSLMVLYFGGRASLIDKTRLTGFVLKTPPFCCCCWCCPLVQVTASNLTRIQALVLQTAIVQPIASFVSFVLWLDGKYDPYRMTLTSVATYLSALSIVSTVVAVYGLMILFRSCRLQLAGHSITPKFLALQLVLIATNVQNLALKFLINKVLPHCEGSLSSSVRVAAIQHMLVIAEMCFLAIYARVFYRKPVGLDMAEGYAIVTEEDVMENLLEQGDNCDQINCRYNSVDHFVLDQPLTETADNFSFSEDDND